MDAKLYWYFLMNEDGSYKAYGKEPEHNGWQLESKAYDTEAEAEEQIIKWIALYGGERVR